VTKQASSYIRFYIRSADTFSELETVNPPGYTEGGVAFSHDSTYLAVALMNSPYITMYRLRQ
jgi:hypothetical protein